MATGQPFCADRFLLETTSTEPLGTTGLALVGMAAFVAVVFTSCGMASLLHRRRENCLRQAAARELETTESDEPTVAVDVAVGTQPA